MRGNALSVPGGVLRGSFTARPHLARDPKTIGRGKRRGTKEKLKLWSCSIAGIQPNPGGGPINQKLPPFIPLLLVSRWFIHPGFQAHRDPKVNGLAIYLQAVVYFSPGWGDSDKRERHILIISQIKPTRGDPHLSFLYAKRNKLHRLLLSVGSIFLVLAHV